jgi:hypothetical protein
MALPEYITEFPDLLQGSDEWLAARRGILTASEIKLILTPTLKVANNDNTRAHIYELLAQRISGFVEPRYISDDMIRGHEDEVWARVAYSENIAPVGDMGFITNSRWGFSIGYSPDGVVGDDGLIECKSRVQKYQVQTIIKHVATGSATIPDDFVLQCQTGLLVSERKWLDFISYSGGLPMAVIRVWPDEAIQGAILEAATAFEEKITTLRLDYDTAPFATNARLYPTERRVIQEMYV